MKETNLKSKNEVFDTVVGVVGMISLVALVLGIIKSISKRTETNIISDKALNVLNNPEEAKRLRKAVNKYHQTGDWDKTEIKTIL